jgi:hypothetical protein
MVVFFLSVNLSESTDTILYELYLKALPECGMYVYM